MILKVGRNQPCPCGSGKKYKKCHGSFTAAPPPQAPVSKSIFEQMVQRHEAAERIRQNQQGFGRPVVSFRAFDRQMVAVGDTIYHSADWKTFPDFLAHYMKTVLGVDWGNAELKKPLTDRHPIMQWYDAVCCYQAETIKEKGKVATCAMTGVVACYLGTAYNLYLLKHNVELQERLVKRLKNPAFVVAGSKNALVSQAGTNRRKYDLKWLGQARDAIKPAERDRERHPLRLRCTIVLPDR